MSAGGGIIQEESEQLETDGFGNFNQAPPIRQSRPGDLGLNPINYTNIEDEV